MRLKLIQYPLVIIVLIIASEPLNAAFDDQFTSARARGLGGAFTAIADEVDGILVNPAGLSGIPAQQLTATGAMLYSGLSDGSKITQNLVGYVYSQPQRGAVGFTWKRLSVSKLYSENIFAIGLARQYEFGPEDRRRTFSLGAAVKLLNWSVTPIVGADGRIVEEFPDRTSIGLDAGIIFRPLPDTPVALAFQNLNRPDVASEGSDAKERLPINTRFGIAVFGARSAWATDLVFKHDQVDVRTGFEWYFYQRTLAIRIGFRLENLAWGTNITTGASFRPANNFRVDYAFVYPVGNVLETFGSHRVSVVYDF